MFASLLQLVKSPHAYVIYVSIDHFCMVRLLVAYEMWIHECGDAKIRRDVSVREILFTLDQRDPVRPAGMRHHEASGMDLVSNLFQMD